MTETATLTAKQNKSMETGLAESIRALNMTPEQLYQLRRQRLRAMLIHAKKNSPWYKEKLAHIDPNDFTEERLTEIPVLTKSILMENWDTIVTDPKLSLNAVEKHLEKIREENQFSYLHDRYRLLVTSGSSGRRGIFIYDWDEWNTYYLMFKRYRFFNEKRTASLLSPLLKKIVVAAIVGTNPIHSIYSLEKSYKNRNTETIHFPITAKMSEIIVGLNDTQPDVLLGSASTIYRLSQEIELNISPKVISLYGEPFYPPVRQAIEKMWPNAGIFNTFGTSEGLSASYCRANHHEMHMNEDLCIVEPVNKEGVPVKKGTVSHKLYMTNLFNYTLPLIRYEIQDELTFLEKSCDCGSAFQLVKEPQSRPDFDFIYDNHIFVNHVVFAYPLLADPKIKEYQVLQTREGAEIKLLATTKIDCDMIQKVITEKLIVLGIKKPRVTCSLVENFQYPPSGKLRRFIPLSSLG